MNSSGWVCFGEEEKKMPIHRVVLPHFFFSSSKAKCYCLFNCLVRKSSSWRKRTWTRPNIHNNMAKEKKKLVSVSTKMCTKSNFMKEKYMEFIRWNDKLNTHCWLLFFGSLMCMHVNTSSTHLSVVVVRLHSKKPFWLLCRAGMKCVFFFVSFGLGWERKIVGFLTIFSLILFEPGPNVITTKTSFR